MLDSVSVMNSYLLSNELVQKPKWKPRLETIINICSHYWKRCCCCFSWHSLRIIHLVSVFPIHNGKPHWHIACTWQMPRLCLVDLASWVLLCQTLRWRLVGLLFLLKDVLLTRLRARDTPWILLARQVLLLWFKWSASLTGEGILTINIMAGRSTWCGWGKAPRWLMTCLRERDW